VEHDATAGEADESTTTSAAAADGGEARRDGHLAGAGGVGVVADGAAKTQRRSKSAKSAAGSGAPPAGDKSVDAASGSDSASVGPTAGYAGMQKGALRDACKARRLPVNDVYRGGNSKPTMVHRLMRYDDVGVPDLEATLQRQSVEEITARLRPFGVTLTNSSLNIYRSYSVTPGLTPEERQRANLIGKLVSVVLDSPLSRSEAVAALVGPLPSPSDAGGSGSAAT